MICGGRVPFICFAQKKTRAMNCAGDMAN